MRDAQQPSSITADLWVRTIIAAMNPRIVNRTTIVVGCGVLLYAVFWAALLMWLHNGWF